MKDEVPPYPLARAALNRLLQARGHSPTDPNAPFSVRPGITQPRRDAALPPPPAPAPLEGPAMPAPAANAEALLDMFLFGESPEGKPEIHLTFKDDVLRGATLQLVKEEAGYDAIFTVGDDTVRRHLEGELERLVQRLQARGMTVKSWRVHVSS